MQEFEYKGIWWLPEYPENKLTGTLSFHPSDGIVLELLGGDLISKIPNVDKRIEYSADNYVFQLICGYTNKGMPFTLYKCRNSGLTWATGYASTKLRVQIIFSGVHFENQHQIKFNKFRVRYSNLEEWLGINGFTRIEDKPGNINYSTPEEIVIRVNDFQLIFTSRLQQERSTVFEVKMSHIAYVVILPDEPLSYELFQDKIFYHLRNFFSLGVTDAVYPINISGEIDIEKNSEIKTREIDIFYSSKEKRQSKIIDTMRLFFDYEDMDADLELYLQNWFSNAEKLQAVYSLYFSMYYISSIYIYVQILILTQTLEAYHRRIYGGYYMNPNEYESYFEIMKNHIPNELESSHRDSLKGRMKYGYEFSLRKRMLLIFNEVLAPYGEILDKVTTNRAAFIGDVVNTRNYLTHYTEELEAEAAIDSKSQYNLAGKLDLLIRLCFLKEMGFTKEKVDAMISRKSWNWRD